MISKVKGLITTILIIYLTYIISTLVWQISAKKDKLIPTNNTIKSSSNNIPQNLFGIEKIITKPQDYNKIQKTKLDIKLIGIIKRKNNSLAIIKGSNNKDKVYKIGDKIDGVARIKTIERSFIIISYNGKDEKITIDRKTNTKLSQSINNIPNISQQQNNNINPIKKNINNTKTEEQTIKLTNKNKNIIKKYMHQAKINPAALLRIIKVVPNFESGLLNGFKLYPASEKQLFKEIGFKSGDLVLEINNTRLDNLSGAFNIGKDLAKQTIFDFIILRNGVQQNIHFNLN